MGRDPDVRVVILRAEGKGFQAGVDIKELAADPTNAALVGVNRGCYEAFAAVYDCEVPVIAAVQGFCLGGGIALAGNADIVVASDDATFGVPEVDRGALGTATHLARFVPQHKLRAMFFTGATITAAELLALGTIERVVPRDELLDAALELARTIAAKSPIVIRRAKESLNAIEPVDVKRSYRFEQGFTFELNLFGDSDELRQAFVDKRDAEIPDRRHRLLGHDALADMTDRYRAVIFDLGGVVFPSPFEAFDVYDAAAGPAERAACAALIRTSSETGAWAALERGELTHGRVRRRTRAEASGAGFTLDARALLDADVGGGFGARPAMLRAIETHPCRTACALRR